MKSNFLPGFILAAVGATLALVVHAQGVGGGYPSSSAQSPSSGSSASAPAADVSKLDTNKDGYISKSEARKDKELSKAFDSLDANHDGKLDPAELSAYGGGSMGSTKP